MPVSSNANVIVLKNLRERFGVNLNANSQDEITTKPIKAELISRAIRTLTNMESEWEDDHNALEIRDGFHLLRHYLERLYRATGPQEQINEEEE